MRAKKKVLARRIRKLEVKAFDANQERLLKEVVLTAENDRKFYPKNPKGAVEQAIKTTLNFMIEGLRSDAKAIRSAAIKQVQSNWRSK